MANSSRSELGDFLRARREKLSPQAAGLPDGRRRRTPGLRREEVAELAGISIDWYVRLEQGRDVSPSAATIDALAQALHLSPAEHAHLRTLARNAERPAFVRAGIPESIRRLVESLHHPAYVAGLRWDLLLWNAAAAEVFTRLCGLAEEDRNVLLYMLTDPDARRLFGVGWADEAERMVARFRTTHDLWASDPAFHDLLERLRRGSPEFALWWESHDVRRDWAGQKLLNHPQKGLLRFEYTIHLSNDDPALALLIYTPL